MTTNIPSRLAKIRERATAIVPGPWRWMGNTATDQVYLGTAHSGRLIIISPAAQPSETVFHHDWCESYTLEQARANVENFCGQHDSDPDGECRCDKIREFLSGEMDPRDPYDQCRELHSPAMSRGITHRPDMWLAEPTNTTEEHREAAEARRKSHGGRRLRSYREFVRYEVLGMLEDGDGRFRDYATRAENPGGDLYREDFISIATPEAEFIERAAEDVPYLLSLIDAYKALASALNRHPNSQESDDARERVSRLENQ